MLDLVREEEEVARAGGLPFEDLLAALDTACAANLQGAYALATDRYMILAGKGRRSAEEAMELDRLDSSLRLALGQKGLLTLSARLLTVLGGAHQAAIAFSRPDAGAEQLSEVWLALGAAGATASQALVRTPIPVKGDLLAGLAARAAEAAEALMEIRSETGWRHRFLGSRKAADRGTSRLLRSLEARGANLNAWVAAAALVDPRRTGARERVDRLGACQRLAGLFACLAMLENAGSALHKAAFLVSEGLTT